MDRTTAPDRPDSPPARHLTAATTASDESALTALRERLAAAEQRAAVAEAVAAERQRIIDAQASHLRMIEAAEPIPAPQPAPPAPEQPKPRKWWRFGYPQARQ